MVKIDIECSNAVSDQVERCGRVLGDIDAEIKGGLQEMLIDFVFGLVEAEDHDAVRIIVVLAQLQGLHV